ncbi:MAG TPA: glycosyltransferase family 39 protein [Solirubrobacteraceae bacterium]|nr:glycosyltransferase family 39 protein [Solirubrobacteraceae bacterium]
MAPEQTAPREAVDAPPAAGASGLRGGGRLARWGPLSLVLAVALGLRLWGVGSGLPYVYNVDEYGHFVPEAVRMFTGGLDPHYFVNPPALTYLLHVVYAIWFLGAGSVSREFALHPTEFYEMARVLVALLGTLSVWLLYLVGSRLFGRGVGLLSAALMAVAFLPVYYGHLALNDSPALVGVTLSLLGSTGILRRGRQIDYLVAGVGVGLAAATKYTAGVVIVSMLAAAWQRYREGGASERTHVALGLCVGVIAAACAFLIANPFSVLDFHLFRSELELQSRYTQMSRSSWVGGPSDTAPVYYLWSFTWGLGWIPALAALGGLATVWRRGRALGWLLVPAPVLYLVFLSVQGRYFGRWLIPILPYACLLGSYFSLALADRAARLAPRARRAFVAVAVLALLAQGVIYSVHSGLVLSRADTRALARTWMIANIPRGSRVVVEPFMPGAWLAGPGRPGGRAPAARWDTYRTLALVLNPATGAPEPPGRSVELENYERTLGPALVSYYERHGYCWVITNYTEAGRAFVNPRALPDAIAYYAALARQGQVAYHVSPYRRGSKGVGFSFDWTFDYYPLSYYRPGPEVTIYRLDRGACAAAGSPPAPGARR